MLAPMMRGVLFGLVLLAGCGPMPRDPDGTLDRVRRDRVFRVGVIPAAPGTTSTADQAAWRRIVGRIASETGARPRFRTGTTEPLLLDLEAGDLDLVVGGRFARDTPWKTRVTLGPPLRADDRTAAHIVARNGENAWIVLVQRITKQAS